MAIVIETNLNLDDMLNELRGILNDRPRKMWKGTIDLHYDCKFITRKERDILYKEYIDKEEE